MSSTGGRFTGKVAIVTGATADPSIGRATATLLAREGASVVINGRKDDQLATAVAEMQAAGYPVDGLAGSLEDEAVAPQLVERAISRFGRIDLLVNTVGGSRGQMTPLKIDRASLMGTIDLNTWTALVLIQAAMERGLADGGGAVVNISSGTVHKTTPMMIAYAAAKSALNAMTRTLARDLGPLGVRVNGVAPGLTKSTGNKSMWEHDDGAAAGVHLPVRRLTAAADIANAVGFLLSDDARQITGVTIDVDGGNHLMGGFTPIPLTSSADGGS